MTEFLKAINVSKIVPAATSDKEHALTILDNINLTFTAKSRNAIVGPSGSGKTTLLGLLAGLDKPSSGQIIFEDQDITKLNEDQRALIRLGRVGFVFQSFQLLPQLTAIENVMLPLEMVNSSGSEKNIREKAQEILNLVGLQHRLHHYPSQLSGGEQQRCALARAYIIKPDLLLADEPTGNLDAHTGEQIIDLLFRLNETEGTCLILATHDKQLAGRCENVITLEQGQVVGA